jgi:hypothetical protein
MSEETLGFSPREGPPEFTLEELQSKLDKFY